MKSRRRIFMHKQSTTFPANPVYYSANDQTIWSYISFGSYPQTEVTGEAMTQMATHGSMAQNTAESAGTILQTTNFLERMSTSAISNGKRFDGESSRMTEKLFL